MKPSTLNMGNEKEGGHPRIFHLSGFWKKSLLEGGGEDGNVNTKN
jgi:hypothetical protein